MDIIARIAGWMEKHPRAMGLMFFVLIGGLSTVAAATIEPVGSERPSDWLIYVLIWVASTCLIFYRDYPLQVLLVGTALVIAQWVLDYPAACDPALWVLFYAATRHGGHDRTQVWRVVGLGLLAIVLVAVLGVIVTTEDLPALAVIGLFMLHGAFALIGEALYQRSRYIEQLEQRAAALEADLENKAALAAVEERTRIAREMHDIIAHGMSTVVVQAQAGQGIVETNPSQARKVLETIENIGRDSVDEMRRMLGVLRQEGPDAELVPQPGLDDIDDLREQVEVAGVELEMSITGDQRSLPPGLELASYRIVQEALTNVLRHAGRPVKVTAAVDSSRDELTIDVTDDGLGAAASSSTAGSGHGLRGMRERVEIYNGTFSAGPTPGGGYGVHATLPVPVRVRA